MIFSLDVHKCLLLENYCCQREALNRTHIPDYQPGKCLLACEAIQHVVGRVSVEISWLHKMRNFGHTGDALRFDNMSHKNYRHHAYCNYIDYIYGKLGQFNRKVVPSCIVSHIRQQWPDPDGNYMGFQQVDEFGQPVNMDELAMI